jgi:hypothetical protein
VEPGPQDGTLLVTWQPVSRPPAGASGPVTGYAVYADGKKVTDVDSPTGDHALIDITKLVGINPQAVTVRTKSRDAQSGDSMATPIPRELWVPSFLFSLFYTRRSKLLFLPFFYNKKTEFFSSSTCVVFSLKVFKLLAENIFYRIIYFKMFFNFFVSHHPPTHRIHSRKHYVNTNLAPHVDVMFSPTEN